MSETYIASDMNLDTHEEGEYEDIEFIQKQNYLHVIQNLKESGSNEAGNTMEELLNKFNQTKESENLLRDKVFDMEELIYNLKYQLEEANAEVQYLSNSVKTGLEEKKQLEKRVDMGQLREQNNLEMIDSMRNQTELLESEINRLKKEQDDLAIELGISGRTKEVFFKEREKLNNENITLKENIGKLKEEKDEIIKDVDQLKSSLLITQQEMDNLKLQTKELERDKGYMTKEASLQRSLVHQLKKNLILLKTHHDSLRMKLNKAESSIQQQKVGLFNIDHANKELRAAINNDQKEISNLNRKIYDLVKDNKDAKLLEKEKDKEIKEWKKKMAEAERKEKHVIKVYTALQVKAEKTIVENKKSRLKKSELSESTGAATENETLKNELAKLKRDYTILSGNLLKTTNLMEEYLKKYEVESNIKRSLEIERDKLKEDMHKYFMQVLNLNDKKDRCKTDKKLLEMKLEEQLLYIRHKEVAIADVKKELEERNTEFRKHLAMYDELKGERNVIAKSLAKTQDTNEDIKRNNRTLSKQLDQLKEMMTLKDNLFVRVERVNKRKVNESLKLKWQLSKSRNQIRACKEMAQNLEKEEAQRVRVLDKSQKLQDLAKKNLMRAVNEKAVLMTQLDRKVAELNCLQDNFNFMDIILKKGDRQYNQRLDDIRILRLEVLKLRREKAMVMKALENSTDLRKEVYHLYTELNMERTKTSALEQEIQTPVNYHRWRFLQGTDPERKDLIDKVNQLQCTVIKKREEISKYEAEIEQLKCVHSKYKSRIERIPGIEVYETLSELKTQLSNRDEEIKTLSSLLTCAEHEIKKLKLKDLTCQQTVDEFKKKYYDVKHNYDKLKQKYLDEKSLLEPCQEFILPEEQGRKSVVDPSCNICSVIVQPLECL